MGTSVSLTPITSAMLCYVSSADHCDNEDIS